MDWIIKKLQEREEYKNNKFYTNLLIDFANNNIDTFYFCRCINIKYHWRSKLFYKLRSFRKDYNDSFNDENGDLKRTYIIGCMLRYISTLKTGNAYKF